MFQAAFNQRATISPDHTIPRPSVPLSFGLVAAALTAIQFLSEPIRTLAERIPGLSVPLALGVVVAMLPFGGLHEARLPDWGVIALASRVNGALWYGIAWLTITVYAGIRAAR